MSDPIAPWATLRAGVTALLVRLAGFSEAEAAAVREAGQSWVMKGPSRASLKWRIRESRTLGQTELRSWYDGLAVIPGDTFVPETGPALGGVIYEAGDNVSLIIEVKAECGAQDTAARDMIERIWPRLALDSARAELDALGLAVASRGPALDVSGPDLSGHAVSAYTFDLSCNGALAATDDPVTTIELLSWCICVK